MFPSQSCHVYKSSCHQRIDPPLTWSVLCVEHLGRTKPRSACAGLWRPSFCVHYLLFMYIPLLWFVARETLCRKCSRSHVHREGKHISTAVAKTVHARAHSCNTRTHTHTQASHKNAHLPLSAAHLLQSRLYEPDSGTQDFSSSECVLLSVLLLFLLFSYFANVRSRSPYTLESFKNTHGEWHCVLAVAKLSGWKNSATMGSCCYREEINVWNIIVTEMFNHSLVYYHFLEALQLRCSMTETGQGVLRWLFFVHRFNKFKRKHLHDDEPYRPRWKQT